MGSSQRVLVIGGGAAGGIVASTLTRRADVTVTLVERAQTAGPGLAYSTTEPLHLLNNYACRMSAVEEDPRHLVDWCVGQGLDVDEKTFVSRATYGAYLADTLDPRVERVHDEAVDVGDLGDRYVVRLASGALLTADLVVLALGNPPPRRPRGLAVEDHRLVVDPWATDLPERVGPRDRVLLIGTGLTTVDVAAQLSSAHPDVTLTAVSRHGLLPLRHLSHPPGPAPTFTVDPDDHPDGGLLRAVLAEVRRSIGAGAQWRCVVESVKASFNDLWHRLSLTEQEQFVAHVARYWEVARHRIAPPMGVLVDDLLDSGRLEVRTTEGLDVTSYDVVVGCTGPAPVSTPGWNPLVDRLAVQGMLWPGPLGLGVDVDPQGALVDAHGLAARGMYAVGAARRGVDWEVAAVPDLRRQAVRLADRLAVAPKVPLAG